MSLVARGLTYYVQVHIFGPEEFGELIVKIVKNEQSIEGMMQVVLCFNVPQSPQNRGLGRRRHLPPPNPLPHAPGASNPLQVLP